MLINFLKVAVRNLLRSKGFSFINIAGLAVGMASAILIILWIQDEWNFEKFHMNKDRIYEVWKTEYVNATQSESNDVTPKVLAGTMQRELPEVERVVRVNWAHKFLFTVGEKRLMASGNTVDSGFLQMFSFPLLKGNPATALNEVYSIVLTQTLAKKLFGEADAMGKIIKLDNSENFTVTGIAKDPPANTKFNFEYLLPWSYLRASGGESDYWGNNSTFTYAQLKQNASLASVAPKLKIFRKKYDKDNPTGEFFLYPLDRWRLYSHFSNGAEEGGLITFVKLFGIIAIFILLIACINFMNLSTARSEKRAKEVGIRKVVGAQKSSLVWQFIGESVLLASIAGIFALILVGLSLNAFNTLTEKNLTIDFGSVYTWLAGVGFVVFTGFLAGSYPAFFLSSFQPVQVLKGTFKSVKALVTPRKMLVVLQFTFAIILIICTLIVRQQIDYAQRRDTGYDKNNLIYHFITGDLGKNYELVKNELLSTGAALSLTRTNSPLTEGYSDTWGIEWQGKDPNDKTTFDRFSADENLSSTAGFQFIQGRDLNLKDFPSDSNAVLLNESAARVMNFKQPVGQIVKDNGMDWHVVGVFRDFILASPYQPTKPMMIEGTTLGWLDVIHIKLNPVNTTAQNIKKTEAIFKKYNPQFPFEYYFIDEQYARKFNNEKRVGTLAALFSGLAIFISCLGLFGLATYMAENRVKEIGVRKVLGASVSGIAALLSADFLKLVFLSFLIAAPIAWWAMHKWLESYPYRVSIEWWIFVVAGSLSILISVITVSYQAIRAGMANPVKSLRSE